VGNPPGGRGGAGTPPASLQAAIAGIWTELLGVPEVAPDQDFFELGGTSLSAARVLTRTRAAVGVKLTPADLFEHPTLAEFAAQVEAAQVRETPE
jgi:acyl carrier protein